TRSDRDWSSDVCSSDLVGEGFVLGGKRRRGILHHHEAAVEATLLYQKGREEATVRRHVHQPGLPPLADVSKLAQADAQKIGGHKIGRASCRENVWNRMI